jgi:hypothetical protein
VWRRILEQTSRKTSISIINSIFGHEKRSQRVDKLELRAAPVSCDCILEKILLLIFFFDEAISFLSRRPSTSNKQKKKKKKKRERGKSQGAAYRDDLFQNHVKREFS